jgi:hypothetical protein
MLRKIVTSMLVLAVLLPIGTQTASAQFTILPSTQFDDEFCISLLNTYEAMSEPKIDSVGLGSSRDDVLACGIKTGRISLRMIPYYITYVANFLLSLVGLICVLFIVVGGYFYIYGGLSENKEKGKKTIYHALLGMGVAILSWVIINVIIAAVTS